MLLCRITSKQSALPPLPNTSEQLSTSLMTVSATTSSNGQEQPACSDAMLRPEDQAPASPRSDSKRYLPALMPLTTPTKPLPYPLKQEHLTLLTQLQVLPRLRLSLITSTD